jgi:hypothetical protein
MTKVDYFIINKVEDKHQFKDLRKYGQCRYCFPGDFSSLKEAQSSEKTCAKCPVFDNEFKFCKNHLEFIAAPNHSSCHEFNDKKAYYEKKKPSKLIFCKDTQKWREIFEC